MKKHVIREYDIDGCNGECPNFYFELGDEDNCWCSKLKRRVYESDYGFNPCDCKPRPFPKDCPLKDS